MKSDWPTRIGWTLFIGLFIAELLDHRIFDPFVFGFSYYVFYVMTQSFKEERGEIVITPSTRHSRTFAVCLIALMYLGFSWDMRYGASEAVAETAWDEEAQ